MTIAETQMAREAGAAPQCCARQVAENAALLRKEGARLRALNPPFAATLARGSSDHAAAFLKVLLELELGIPVVSQAPSIGALYHATSDHFRDVPLIAVSQSGRSPDLLAAADDARRKGALVIAIVNDDKSPLAEMADIVIPVLAGTETSVAATKSFIGTLSAMTHLTAEWGGKADLLDALSGIGETLEAAWQADWTPAVPLLRDAQSLLVLGRGYTLPVANEAALKFKETAGLHAEAFSIAEVAHGPMTLIGPGDPVLVFGPGDAAREGLADRVADFAAREAMVIGSGEAADLAGAALRLPTAVNAQPPIDAIARIQSFYRLANALALARGRDPDHPPHLAKVTRTL